ncbi:TonB-dependent receptor [Halioxenophilus sp. WMMB6]|uniref:TonB-dependent receptor n=1 Tax=Halioxenophilus sp. WMMB6 TaxID=3073815 RepID=UPI00295ECAE1|nr:TonB-dependent receptor [Halioxenophilus sp. WMMB6]
MKISNCAHNKKSYLAKSMLVVSVSLAGQAMAEGGKILEEIVVTAEHKEASLQDTQISVTAVSAQDIQDLGISNGIDLGHVAPNLVVNSYQGGKSGMSINMRGISQNETLVTYDPAVGVYIDDVLLSKNVGAILDVVDMERIEILRGPQGTLYGRNTMGGAVNFVTQKPTDQFEGKLVANYGRYGQQDLKGVFNIPLVPASSTVGALNMRVSAATINRDGLTKNNYSGPSPYASPSYNTELFGTGGNDDSRLRKQTDELETKDRQAVMVHLQWQPTDYITARYSYDKTEIDEIPNTPWVTTANPARTAGVLLAPYNIGRADRPSAISVNGAQVAETDVEGQALNLDFELTDTLSFKSITSSRKLTNFSAADSDGSPLSIIQTVDTNKNDQFTQEFRLTGGSERFDYSAGLFYMEEEGSVDQRLDAFGFPERTTADFKNDNWALFGQSTYDFTDALRVTVGFRYTEEDRELSKIFYRRGSTAGVDFGTAKRSFDNFSPMVSLAYDINPDTMTYFKVSTGFQSGGMNVREQNLENFKKGFDEEKLLAYEWGVKANIGERVRVNSALWFSDYTDKRVNQFDPETLGNTVRNAGIVQAYGLELEMQAQLNNYFLLGIYYGYQKPEYKEYDTPNPDCVTNPDCSPKTFDLSNDTNIVYTPEHSGGANLAFEKQLGFGYVRARVDWAWKDGYTFIAQIPERNSQKAHSIWNAKVTLDEIQGPGDTTILLSLWGKNLLDESYYYNGVNIYETFGFDINTYAEPRTYGMEVGLQF